MTKEEVIKKIEEILAKDKRFKNAKVKVDFVNKKPSIGVAKHDL